jgi:hypothetical protein
MGLLAYSQDRCRPNCGALPGLPDVFQENPHACHSTSYDPYNLAFRSLGLDMVGPP